MKKLCTLLAAAAAFTGYPGILTAQDFGLNSTNIREVSSAELAKPDILEADIAESPNPGPVPVPKPIYLVYRYYSCSPWYPWHIRNVFTDVVPQGQYGVEIDTAGAVNEGDNVEGQIVTDIEHPAYGLYCLTVRVCVPWHAWVPNLSKRWYIRWAWRAPYWCWHDHWWYYWRRQIVTVPMSGAQEVPPNSSLGTATATVSLSAPNVISYSIPFSGLTSGLTLAHFHGPATPGVNAGVLLGLNFNPNVGQTSGTITGTATASAALLNALATGQCYLNIHTSNFPGGELRGQVPVITPIPIWCPYGPVWWPYTYWNRIGNIWGLTICHPYCYRWNPFYVPRPFCLYGLRYYYTPFGNVRTPAVDQLSPNAVPLNNTLYLNSLLSRPWLPYDAVSIGGIIQRPPYYYWPFTPYCQRWYWFRVPSFTLYRYNPPVVHFSTWLNPTPNPVNADFPDMPMPDLPGTMCTLHTRPVAIQPGDTNGDGFVDPRDYASIRQQGGTQAIDSFFDVFVDIEAPPADAAAKARKKQ